jgi:hypothetical protein
LHGDPAALQTLQKPRRLKLQQHASARIDRLQFVRNERKPQAMRVYCFFLVQADKLLMLQTMITYRLT